MAPALCSHSGTRLLLTRASIFHRVSLSRLGCCQVLHAVGKKRNECEEGVCLPLTGPNSQPRPFVSIPLVRTQSRGYIQLQGRLGNIVQPQGHWEMQYSHTMADGRTDVGRHGCGQAALVFQSWERIKLLLHSGPVHSVSCPKYSAFLPLLPPA